MTTDTFLTLNHAGKTYAGFTAEQLLQHGVPQAAIDDAIAAHAALQARDAVRARIDAEAGDPQSMLGTTADAAALATLGVCALTVAVHQATSWATFQTAYTDAISELAGDHDMATISAAFLAKVGDGSVKVPAIEKGIEAVVAEIETRSTAVSDAIAGA